MRWRHLQPGELNHELIWLSVTLSGAVLGWLVLKSGVPLPKCMWHELTGIPCPGCGATRCAKALAAGDMGRALLMNPFAFFCFITCALYSVYSAIVLALRLPRLRMGEIPPWLGWTTRLGAGCALLVNWVWLIWDRR
jgi:hypothetical protein